MSAPEQPAGPLRLTDPLANKGTAFTTNERLQSRLEGLLPPRVESIEEQAARVLAQLRASPDPLQRYRVLSARQNENETLFYRVVLDHMEETLPIIYTPRSGRPVRMESAVRTASRASTLPTSGP